MRPSACPREQYHAVVDLTAGHRARGRAVALGQNDQWPWRWAGDQRGHGTPVDSGTSAGFRVYLAQDKMYQENNQCRICDKLAKIIVNKIQLQNLQMSYRNAQENKPYLLVPLYNTTKIIWCGAK